MGMYKKEKRELTQLQEARLIIEVVKNIRQEQPRIGVRKLQVLLKEILNRQGVKIGRDGLFDLLREFDMLVKRSRYKHYSTESRHLYYKYPNQIKNIQINKPNQLWVGDITYIETAEGFCYLFVLTDGYSHKIVGHCLSESYSVKGAIAALKMALQYNRIQPGFVHHTDRGIQYCSKEYTSILKQQNAIISMTENGDPYENAIAERVNGILKTELLKTRYRNGLEAREEVDKAIKIYNNKRPHMSIGLLTPHIAHQQSEPLKKLWKPRQYLKTKKSNQETLVL